MSEEALLILKMVQEGKITPEQGMAFLDALKPSSNSSESPKSSDPSGWSSVSQVQRRLAELQQRLGEMQSKLSAAQASGSSSNFGSGSIKLPFGMGEFNVSDVIDEAVKGMNQLKAEAAITAKRAARSAQKEARRFRQDAERLGKNIRVEVNFGFDSTDRPANTGALPEMSSTDEHVYDLPTDGKVSFCNPYGELTISGTSADGKVHVKVEKQVWAASRAGCEAILDAVKAVFSQDDESKECAIQIEAPNGKADSLSVNMIVQTPPNTAVGARTSFGVLQVESMEACPKHLQSTSGDIRILNVRVPESASEQTAIETQNGNLFVSQWSGASLKVESMNGDLHFDLANCPELYVRSANGDVNLRSVTLLQDMVIDASGGDIVLQTVQIGGSAKVKTNCGDVDITELHSNTITIETVSGDLDLVSSGGDTCDASFKTISGDVTLRQLNTRSLYLATTSGDVVIHQAGATIGTTTVLTVSGDLNMDVDGTAHASFTLSTHDGTISCKADVNEREGDGRQYLAGKLGDGALGAIRLQTVSGDIALTQIK